MADARSRREKLEAMLAPNSGASDGERANARALLDQMEPEAQASEPVTSFDDPEAYWNEVFAAMGDDTLINLHDMGILQAWDASGRCTICGKRH